MKRDKGIRSEQGTEAAQVERNLAHQAFEVGDRELAWNYLQKTLGRLSENLLDTESRSLFVQTSLEFSNLCMVLGQGFNELKKILLKANTVSKNLGDRRSRALMNLHLGRLYFFGNRIPEAMEALSQGKKQVEDLDDEDIRIEAAEFIGMYYFIQGRFSEARPHFEMAAPSYGVGELKRLMNPWAPFWLALCPLYLAQFHEAIGTAEYYHRLALAKSDLSLASLLQVLLGLILLIMDRGDEAHSCLSSALEKSIQNKNAPAATIARAGLGLRFYREGQFREARDWIAKAIAESRPSGVILDYASDHVLETMFELDRRGFECIPSIDLQNELKRIIRQSNIHLRGVALRLRAAAAADMGEDDRNIESLLDASEEYLNQSGDPVQLAKTRVEFARLKLKQGDQEEARFLAQKAYKGLSRYGQAFYPDELRYLLVTKQEFSRARDSRAEFLETFVDMIHELGPGSDLRTLLTRTLASTNRLFDAERGAIFLFSGGGKVIEPVLRAGRNLGLDDVSAKEFRWSLDRISDAYRQNKPLLLQNDEMATSPGQAKAVLCVPFEVEGRVQGVLYHDSLHVRECFDGFETLDLVRIAKSIANYVENIMALNRRLQQKTSMSLTQLWQSNAREIIAKNPRMLNILAQVDHIAASDGSVLILGETGVGKELFAHRLHEVSSRRNGPLVIVDPTTIPETLVESELFGHEKGAFTGADRQKPGRLELANGGTLFIDEVGEIPKSVQAKLLRALQEKTLVRVGGTSTLRSDFRLLAATSRDLADEVAAGRFREDLYYRINVVPLTIPPLRERKEDIPALASYFLGQYASKYKRPEIRLTKEDEARLMAYDWPGNVRELANVMERAVILSMGGELEVRFPEEGTSVPPQLFSDYPTLDEIQRRYIQQVLDKTGGKLGGSGGAAEILGIKRTTLQNRMKKLGLR